MKLIDVSKETQIKEFTNFLKKRRAYTAFIKGFKHNMSLPKEHRYCSHCEYITLKEFYIHIDVSRWTIAAFYWNTVASKINWSTLHDLWRTKLDKNI